MTGVLCTVSSTLVYYRWKQVWLSMFFQELPFITYFVLLQMIVGLTAVIINYLLNKQFLLSESIIASVIN
jgi:hypothetical protein